MNKRCEQPVYKNGSLTAEKLGSISLVVMSSYQADANENQAKEILFHNWLKL